MNRFRPGTLILVGFFLVLFGFLIPFLTVVKVIPSDLVLLLISFAASVAGLFLGIIGAASHVRQG